MGCPHRGNNLSNKENAMTLLQKYCIVASPLMSHTHKKEKKIRGETDVCM